jgi:hypothetical protein
MKDCGLVYIWYDKKHKRFYIGCHWGNESDGYICSSRWMNDSYRKRSQDFKRRVVTKIHTNMKDLLEEEYKWLSLIKDEELGKKYYNISKKHFGHWTIDNDKRKPVGEKISKKRKEYFNNNPDALEELKTRGKIQHEKNPANVKKASLAAEEYYKANPEVKKERIKKLWDYYEKNPEELKNRNVHTANNLKNYHKQQRKLKGKIKTPSGVFDTPEEAFTFEGISKCTLYRRLKSDKYPDYIRI